MSLEAQAAEDVRASVVTRDFGRVAGSEFKIQKGLGWETSTTMVSYVLDALEGVIDRGEFKSFSDNPSTMALRTQWLGETRSEFAAALAGDKGMETVWAVAMWAAGSGSERPCATRFVEADFSVSHPHLHKMVQPIKEDLIRAIIAAMPGGMEVLICACFGRLAEEVRLAVTLAQNSPRGELSSVAVGWMGSTMAGQMLEVAQQFWHLRETKCGETSLRSTPRGWEVSTSGVRVEGTNSSMLVFRTELAYSIGVFSTLSAVPECVVRLLCLVDAVAHGAIPGVSLAEAAGATNGLIEPTTTGVLDSEVVSLEPFEGTSPEVNYHNGRLRIGLGLRALVVRVVATLVIAGSVSMIIISDGDLRTLGVATLASLAVQMLNDVATGGDLSEILRGVRSGVSTEECARKARLSEEELVLACYRARVCPFADNSGAFGILRPVGGFSSPGLSISSLSQRERWGNILLLADGSLGVVVDKEGSTMGHVVKVECTKYRTPESRTVG